MRAPDPYRPLTDDELRRFFAAYPWTFAKTAVRNPHWYIVRGKNRVPDSLFEAVVQTIRDRGMPFWHWRKQYTILVLDGFRYWTWGAPVGETTILNRAKHDA